jgi:hypothetical protein
MTKILAIKSLRSNCDDTVFHREEILKAGIGVPVALNEFWELQRFNRGLEIAEEEARSENQARKAANQELHTRSVDPKLTHEIIGFERTLGAKGSGHVQYDHDTESAQKEVVSNVVEVQQYNE